jgi:hypothetical protein
MTQTIVNFNQVATSSCIYLLPGNTTTTEIIKDTTTWHFLSPYDGVSTPTVYHFENNDFQFLEGRKVAVSSISGDGTHSYFNTSSAHGFNTNDRILIDTSDSYYDGEYAITYVDATQFRITKAFTSTSTGFSYIGARFKVLHPEYYKYNISFCVSFRTTVSNPIDHTSFEFMLKNSGNIIDTQVQVNTPDSSVWHQTYPTSSPYQLDLTQDDELIWAYSASSSTNPLLFRSLIIKIDRVI